MDGLRRKESLATQRNRCQTRKYQSYQLPTGGRFCPVGHDRLGSTSVGTRDSANEIRSLEVFLNRITRDSDSQKALLEFTTFDVEQELVPASDQGPLKARQNDLGPARLLPPK